ncbi:MAG: RHS repeat-associated protein [Kiritimatiellia bacterium]|jgi:RHS repeat-associated protein
MNLRPNLGVAFVWLVAVCLFIPICQEAQADSLPGRRVSIHNRGSNTLDLSWLAITNAPYEVQFRPVLQQGDWSSLGTTSGRDGDTGFSVPPTNAPAGFYRVLFPEPVLRAGEPAIGPGTGGETLYVTGQHFYCGDQIRVGGVLITNVTFIDATLLSVVLPPLAPGRYDVEVISGHTGALLSVLHAAIDVALPPHSALQEPPEWPPAGPMSFLSKKGYDYYQAQSANSAVAPASSVDGHVTVLKAPDHNGQIALAVKAQEDNGHVTVLKAQEHNGHVTVLKGQEHNGHVTVLKGQEHNGHVTVLKAPEHNGHVTVLKGQDHNGHVTVLKQQEHNGHVTVLKSHEHHGHVTVLKAADHEVPHLQLHSGEVQQQVVDLSVPGRGLDFAWVRSYRSRTGSDTAQGVRWSHSYDVRCVTNGPAVEVYDGTGRRDTYYLQADGNYSCPGFFREGTFSNNVFRLTFADSGFWQFAPLGGTPDSGRLSRIEDRNGNAMTCEYDGAGNLTRVLDTQGRTNVISYANDRISSVTDSTGRRVRYAYYADREPGGNLGDLKSVTSPPVTGTPNGNDFPGGKTNRYTYTSGAQDAQANHLMLTCVDGFGRTRGVCSYDLAPASASYLRCHSLQEGAFPATCVTYFPQTPSPSNDFAAMRCIVNDPVGNVSELFFDVRNRCVTLRDYTGLANPGQPVVDTANLSPKLRQSDPNIFETYYSWNNDSLCTQQTLPNGLVTRFVYAGDAQAGTRVRKRSDLLLQEWDSLVGADSNGDGKNDLRKITTQYTHDPRFGTDPTASRRNDNPMFQSNEMCGEMPLARSSGGGYAVCYSVNAAARAVGRGGGYAVCYSVDGRLSTGPSSDGGGAGESCDGLDNDCDGFVTSVTDPRGTVTTGEYDASGNRVRCVALAGGNPEVDFVYNTFGQCIAVTNAADVNGYRRVDTLQWGARLEGLVRDAVGTPVSSFAATLMERDDRGNVTRLTDPNGNQTLMTYNALDQLVAYSSPPYGEAPAQRVTTHVFYDANDNVVRVDSDNRRDTGALVVSNDTWTTRYAYDILNRCTQAVNEVDEARTVVDRFTYDGAGRLVSHRSPLATSGSEPSNRRDFEYDERDLLLREIVAPGSSVASTNEWRYTLNGRPEVAVYVRRDYARCTYDGFDRIATLTDAQGNNENWNFNGAGDLKVHRIFGETNDVPGGAGNQLLDETVWTYDGLGRCTDRADSFFDVTSGAGIGDGVCRTQYDYAPNGQCRQLVNDRGDTNSFGYDSLGRRVSSTSPRGDVVLELRDAFGNVTRQTSTEISDLGGNPQVFVTDYVYDGLNRCVSSTDNVGNTNRWFYDSRDLVVRSTDPLGNEVCYLYDGLSRRTGSLSYVGPCDADTNGVNRGITINTSHVEYDANSRVTQVADANSNSTHYAYDVRDRSVAVIDADNSVEQYVWDLRDNLVETLNPNGTFVSYTYDASDRVVHCDIVTGDGVMPTTTFETFRYDGLSRLMVASNDLSSTAYAYDSLGRRTSILTDGFLTVNTYDAVGNRVAQRYPSGLELSYTYDALNQVKSVSVITTSAPPASLFFYDYAGPGRAVGIRRQSIMSTTMRWSGVAGEPNAAGDFGSRRVASVHTTKGPEPLEGSTFHYDRNQNRTLRAQDVPFGPVGEALTNVMHYDALNRLRVSVSTRGSNTNRFVYDLDGRGNRNVVTTGMNPEVYTRDAAQPEPADFQMDQYTQTPLGQHGYDTNGNLVVVNDPIGETVYRYDYADRLVQVDVDDGVGSLTTRLVFTYDALGRRISKTSVASGLPPTRYVYDDGVDDDCDGILEMRPGNGLDQRFVHVAGSVPTCVRIGQAGDIVHYLCDDLGNIVALTDEAGNVLERYEYDDYGAPTFLAPDGRPLLGLGGFAITASPVGNPFFFRGMQWDDESGLYLYRSRYFDPKTGQYTSRALRAHGDVNALVVDTIYCPRVFADNNPWSVGQGGVAQAPFNNSNSQKSQESRSKLKEYFQTGDKPTQDQNSTSGNFVSGRPPFRGHVTVLK